MSEVNGEGPAIGIDLGTSYSCVGIWQNGRVDIIANDQGNRVTPSRVAFTDTVRLIGEAADNQATTNPTNTIFEAKRLIGRRFNDEVVQQDIQLWPFKVVAGPNFGEGKKPLVSVTYKNEVKQFSAEEISAMILSKMKGVAESYLGSPVKKAVVTVPAYFNDAQRQATKDAGTIAGLNVLHIINEPTAAAIAYGLDNQGTHKNILVFDLGGGTFDVSLVSVQQDVLEVKAVGGDAHLGGSDFDVRMMRYILAEFEKKHKVDLSQNPRALGRLRSACERAKRTLSGTAETSIDIDGFHNGVDFKAKISRARFDMLNIDLYKKCIDLVEQCLKDGKVGKSEVDEVILVGGSTRIPKVQQLLQEFFDGKELNKSINPDEAVAYGAAVHAGNLGGGTSSNNNTVLVDVTPLSLGVEVATGIMSVVIPKNTSLPTTQKRDYGLKIDTRTQGGDPCVLKIAMYEGERRRARDNNSLGVFELEISPSQSSGSSRLIIVCFEIDIDGILHVSAEDADSGNRSQITVTNRSRLTVSEMERLMNEAEEFQVEDNNYNEMVSARNDLEDYALEMKMKADNCGQENGGVKEKIEQIFDWLEWSCDQALRAALYVEKLRELQAICRPLIALMK